MVVHEDIGVEEDRIDVQGLGEDVQKCLAVVIIPEDVSSLVSAARHMVHRAWILDAQRSGHGPLLQWASRFVNNKDLTPQSSL